MINNPNFDKVRVELMLSFLKKCYPVTRLKYKNRFKRGVNVDSTIMLLPKDTTMFIGKIYNILELVYDATPEEISYAIEHTYNFNT